MEVRAVFVNAQFSKYTWSDIFLSSEYYMDALWFLQDILCPQFELPDPLLIPVGIKKRIEFQGKNMDKYSVQFSCRTLLCCILLGVSVR